MPPSCRASDTVAEPASPARVTSHTDVLAGVPACATQILRCPLTHRALHPCPPEELARLNARITAGQLQHADGSRVDRTLTGALLDSAGQYAYRVDHSIINLIGECAIVPGNTPSDQATSPHPRLHETTRRAQRFYDEWGWTRTDADTFVDAAEWEDLRPVSADYRSRCHRRVRRFLPESGRFLVDVGCGPIQYPEYLEYSVGYDYRVCVDVSYRALQEARRKLGTGGIYVLADVSNLPLQDGCADALTCLHVLYHVPKERQAAGLREMARVLRTDGQGVIVYSWGPHSILMKLLLVGLTIPRPIQKWWAWRKAQLRHLLSPKPPAATANVAVAPARESEREAPATATAAPTPTRLPLEFHPHPWSWWRSQRLDCQVEPRSWRCLSVPFLQKCIHPHLAGGLLLRLAYALEERFPHLLGRIGAYPLLVLRK